MPDQTFGGDDTIAPAFAPTPPDAMPPSVGTVDRGPDFQDEAAAPASAGENPSIAMQAKQTLVGALDRQKQTAADAVEKLAGTMRSSGEQFEGQQDWIASAVRRGADELSTLSGTLRDQDLGALAGQVQTFARARPMVFVGGTFAVGFAFARLAKLVANDTSRDDLSALAETQHVRA